MPHAPVSERRRGRVHKGTPLVRAWLIPPANWYLGWLSTGVSILPTRQWLDWECRLHAELSGLIAQPPAVANSCWRRLRVRNWRRFSRPPRRTFSTKIDRSDWQQPLWYTPHQHSVLYPDGVSRPFSHGDATAHNVICDVGGGHDIDRLRDRPRSPPYCRVAPGR